MIYKSRFGDIHYNVIGKNSLPWMVFTHGVGMNHKTFENQVEGFKDSHRILVWDLPGHGYSSLTNYNMRFTILSAECLFELLEALQIGRAVFVGQSLGSMIVQHFQIRYPEKVDSTIHVPGIELKSHVGAWAKFFVPLMMLMFKLFPAKTFYNSFGKHRAVRRDVQEYLSQAMSMTGMKLALDITKDMVYDLIDQWPTPPKSPLLITYGSKDLFFIRKAARDWHKKTPNNRCIEIGNANHIANQDNPEMFNEAVRAFLQECSQIK